MNIWNSEELAKFFHDEYDKLAPRYGWRTQISTQVTFDQLPDNNRALMVAVCEQVVEEFRQERKAFNQSTTEAMSVLGGEIRKLREKLRDNRTN